VVGNLGTSSKYNHSKAEKELGIVFTAPKVQRFTVIDYEICLITFPLQDSVIAMARSLVQNGLVENKPNPAFLQAFAQLHKVQEICFDIFSLNF